MIIKPRHLSAIGDEVFETLVKSLLNKIIGPGITPFSKGKDGAREATFIGRANYPSSAEMWDGSWIFQVKHSDISAGLKDARTRIKSLISPELAKLDKYGYFSSGQCDNYIFVTNVPFSKQMHDTIKCLVVAKGYPLKHFDFWDGTKVCGYINSSSDIRETFFPPTGMHVVQRERMQGIQDIFVPPREYGVLRQILEDNKFVVIVGQPHVGKTMTSYHLAYTVYKTHSLDNVVEVPLIDALRQVPRLCNSIIIFDDLFGETEYVPIGRHSAILTHLLRRNYIVATCRDYIFSEAARELKCLENVPADCPLIMQEGSYSDADLRRILANHLRLRQDVAQRTGALVKHNEGLVVNSLRFPHNIQVFVAGLGNVGTKQELRTAIAEAKIVQKVIVRWFLSGDERSQNILVLCSIFKVVSVEDAVKIVQRVWQYTMEDIQRCLDTHSRIVTQQNGKILFKHPSFRQAIYELPQNHERIAGVYASILLETKIGEEYRKQMGLELFKMIGQYIREETLRRIVGLPKGSLDKRIRRIAWAHLVRRGPDVAFVALKDRVGSTGKSDRSVSSEINLCKRYLTKAEVFDFVSYLFNIRHEDYLLCKRVIVDWSFTIRERVSYFIKLLTDDDVNDIKLKIALLGIYGSKYPEEVIPVLEKYANHKYATIRRVVYAALRLLPNKIKPGLVGKLNEYLARESKRGNRLRLESLIKELNRMNDGETNNTHEKATMRRESDERM